MNSVFDLIRNLRIALGCIGELLGYLLRFVSSFSGVGPRWPPGCQLGMCKRREERLRADRPRSELLATFDNYHLTLENGRFLLVILHGHLWGGRFQASAQIGSQNIRVGKKGFSRLKVKICSGHIKANSLP